MARIKTDEEIWAEKEFDFETLLEPYREGGTEDSPVRRTVGTILDYFLNKKKYPKEVVGAAFLSTFVELKNGREFKGDGSYGSPGRELVTHMRLECDRLLHEKTNKEVYEFAAILQKALAAKPGFFRRMMRKFGSG